MEETIESRGKHLEINHENKDTFGLLRFIKAKWKFVLSMFAIGTILSIAGAFSIDKVYRPFIELSKPKEAEITQINSNGFTQFSSEYLFKLYFDSVRSKRQLIDFVNERQLLQQFFPDSDIALDQSKYEAELADKFQSELLAKGRKDEDSFLSKVNAFRLSIESSYEDVAVDTLNEYVVWVQNELLSELQESEGEVVQARIKLLNREIEGLRDLAKAQRELTITSMEEENAKSISDLENKKDILIQRAKQDRLTKVANLEEVNRLNLERLVQQRELILVRAKQQRESEIAEAKEALAIATSLGIINPTPIDELGDRNLQTDNPQTNINLNNVQELPLYLMGTKFLQTKINSLSERNNDELFVKELHNIDMEISAAKRNKEIELLKARESDEALLAALNEIQQQISQIENDPELLALQSRKSDDPYIPNLAVKFSEINTLSGLSLNFDETNLFVIDRPAFAKRVAAKPKRTLIVFLGGILSLLLALIFVSLQFALNGRVES